MVCVDDFVVIGDIGVGFEEEGVVIGYVVEEIIWVVCYDLDMFGGDFVGDFYYFFVVFGNDYLIIGCLGFGGDFGCW